MACSFQGVSLCYTFFFLLVSSVSGFRPDTKGTVEDTFFFFKTHLFSRTLGREGGMLQTNNTGVCLQCLSHTGSAPTHGACSLPAHTARALGCSARNHPRPALGCLHFPGPSRSGSGTRVVLRGADSRLGLRFVPFPDIAAQMMRCLARAIAATYRLPPLGYLGVKPAHLLRQMLTVQTPKKF